MILTSGSSAQEIDSSLAFEGVEKKMTNIHKLHEIRGFAGARETVGLSDSVIEDFISDFPELKQAIDEAYATFLETKEIYSTWFKKPEGELIQFLQSDFLNFYKPDAVNPYISLAARGPWLVTTHGSVIHDSGGYGMLGFGQNFEPVFDAMSKHAVMANIMTANFSQKKFTEKLFKEIGHRRPVGKQKPYDKFLCLNSGSESVTAAMRISDINAKTLTDAGGKHAGKTIRFLAFKGGFHGRTDRPAQASHSSSSSYKSLASFRDHVYLDIVEPNNKEQLIAAFDRAKKENIFYEMMLIEPVMGEGNPGVALDPKFYELARKLTRENDTLLFADSIQAGIRGHGYLSMMDYPGFEELDPPDFETYSKALNAGQYPLSVLAMREEIAKKYKAGVYGNTMTANPRALEVACAVLDSLTPEIRKNIQDRGKEFLEKFAQLKKEFPNVVTAYAGTGLLCSVSLAEEGYQVLGPVCVEKEMRLNGFGVIHGGKNALRFTPHFRITSREIDLVISGVRQALKKGPIYK